MPVHSNFLLQIEKMMKKTPRIHGKNDTKNAPDDQKKHRKNY